MHGFVREERGGTEIITIALKNNFDFYRFEYNKSFLDLYAGVNVFHVTGLRYQASRRNNYPDSYYSIGSIRGLLYLGARGSVDAKGPHQGYFESGVNDLWIINSLNNSETININDYISLALGYVYVF